MRNKIFYIKLSQFLIAVLIISLVHGGSIPAMGQTQRQGNDFISDGSQSGQASKQYRPLKVSDFVSNEKLDMGDEIMDFTEINIEPEFMKKEGFIEGKKSRYIRPDVIIWSEDIAHYAGATYSIYLKFNTEAAAKAFFKTGEELGWKYSNPDTWTNNHLVLHAEVSRDGDLVEISLSHH